MSALLNFLGPTLFILCFYLLLGAVIWIIIHPPHIQLTLPNLPAKVADPKLAAQFLTNSLPQDPISRQTVRLASFLAIGSILAILLPLSLPLRVLAAQALGFAFLLLWFDRYHQQRQHQSECTELMNALRSPIPQVAQVALRNAQQRGWFNDGSMCAQDFRHVVWTGANLHDANLVGANLTHANLCGADLRNANLTGAILTDALLATANLTGATMVNAQLNGIQAKAANFHRANCRSANLDGAKLQRANLTYVNLNNSTLYQTNLKQALLVGIELKDAQFDIATKWPKHFYPELSGAKHGMPPQISAQTQPVQKLLEHSG